jgi:hypothetical protein
LIHSLSRAHFCRFRPLTDTARPYIPRPMANLNLLTLVDRVGHPIKIDKNVAAFVTSKAFRKVGASIDWPWVTYDCFSVEYCTRAVQAVLDHAGKRCRFAVTFDKPWKYTITRLEGVRGLPRHLKRQFGYNKPAAEMTGADLVAAVEAKLEYAQNRKLQIAPLHYNIAGRPLSPTSKYGWESLEIGQHKIYEARPGVLQKSFNAWAKRRGWRNAYLETSKIDKVHTLAVRIS